MLLASQTFEGHTNSVLRVNFITAGMQMLSCASDGLVKLWNVRDEQCVATMDGHEDKVGSSFVRSVSPRSKRSCYEMAFDALLAFCISLGLGTCDQRGSEDCSQRWFRQRRQLLGGQDGSRSAGKSERSGGDGSQVSSKFIFLVSRTTANEFFFAMSHNSNVIPPSVRSCAR